MLCPLGSHFNQMTERLNDWKRSSLCSLLYSNVSQLCMYMNLLRTHMQSWSGPRMTMSQPVDVDRSGCWWVKASTNENSCSDRSGCLKVKFLSLSGILRGLPREELPWGHSFAELVLRQWGSPILLLSTPVAAPGWPWCFPKPQAKVAGCPHPRLVALRLLSTWPWFQSLLTRMSNYSSMARTPASSTRRM